MPVPCSPSWHSPCCGPLQRPSGEPWHCNAQPMLPHDGAQSQAVPFVTPLRHGVLQLAPRQPGEHTSQPVPARFFLQTHTLLLVELVHAP